MCVCVCVFGAGISSSAEFHKSLLYSFCVATLPKKPPLEQTEFARVYNCFNRSDNDIPCCSLTDDKTNVYVCVCGWVGVCVCMCMCMCMCMCVCVCVCVCLCVRIPYWTGARQDKGPRWEIPESTVKSIMWQMLNGLNYMHTNWVLHR